LLKICYLLINTLNLVEVIWNLSNYQCHWCTCNFNNSCVITKTSINANHKIVSERPSNVEIVVHKFRKPFLGGFRQQQTGLEFHNATTQTPPKGINKDWPSQNGNYFVRFYLNFWLCLIMHFNMIWNVKHSTFFTQLEFSWNLYLFYFAGVYWKENNKKNFRSFANYTARNKSLFVFRVLQPSCPDASLPERVSANSRRSM
jgi:hypothetical protein